MTVISPSLGLGRRKNTKSAGSLMPASVPSGVMNAVLQFHGTGASGITFTASTVGVSVE
jgi:hypothetical protein